MNNIYHINPQTLTILGGPHYIGSTEIKKLTRCGNPDVLLAVGPYDLDDGTRLVPQVWPELAEGFRFGGEPVVYADRVEIPAIPKTQAELDAERDQRIQQMEQAVVNYIETKGGQNKGRIHFTAAPMVDRKAAAAKPKSKAINDWAQSCWMLYYQREAALLAGAPWEGAMLDFSSCGTMPYTLLEAMQE